MIRGQVEVYSTGVSKQVTVCREKEPSLRKAHGDGVSREGDDGGQVAKVLSWLTEMRVLTRPTYSVKGVISSCAPPAADTP
jgi:hypothetical protein